MKIKFGTDGWRAIIAKEFTVENVVRISIGVGLWLKQQELPQRIVIGHDCRFAGELFVEHASLTFAAMGIEVLQANSIATTPAISYAANHQKAGLGVIFTASHNPAAYHGYKLKSHLGGPMLPQAIAEIEALIPSTTEVPNRVSNQTNIQKFNCVEEYINKVKANFNLKAIANSNLNIVYDAMYGSGQFVVPHVLPTAQLFRCEHNPHFYGLNPEPIDQNLGALKEYVKQNPNIDFVLINDGDADRIGLMSGDGQVIDSHHIMLLLIYVLAQYKGRKGKVVTGFSSTVKIEKLAQHFGFEVERVPIGFKHIAHRMATENVLMGGEESGGIAVAGFIPERDGIWNGLVLLEFMAESGKTLNELIQEIYAITGSFGYYRNDLHITEELKQSIIAKCEAGHYQHFGPKKVERLETLDGFKYLLNESEWIMIRASGTEPLLRVYAESNSIESAKQLLEYAKATIL